MHHLFSKVHLGAEWLTGIYSCHLLVFYSSGWLPPLSLGTSGHTCLVLLVCILMNYCLLVLLTLVNLCTQGSITNLTPSNLFISKGNPLSSFFFTNAFFNSDIVILKFYAVFLTIGIGNLLTQGTLG
jgi:hypothetical protein